MRFVIVLAVCLPLVSSASSVYRLSDVRRVATNLYSFRSGTQTGLIETRMCMEVSYGGSAALRYEAYGYDNKLIFDGGRSCDVVSVTTM